jgi:hypothetical protein
LRLINEGTSHPHPVVQGSLVTKWGKKMQSFIIKKDAHLFSPIFCLTTPALQGSQTGGFVDDQKILGSTKNAL